MTRIFISHSHADKAFATRLAEALRERGFQPWIDHEGIRGGARWSTSIQEGLDACRALVLVLSPAAMDSSNVEDEWQYALDEGTPIVPVRIEPTKVHFQLKRIQHVDFHERDFEGAVRELERSLREAVAEERTTEGQEGEPADETTPAPCPYRGLHAFREEDAPFFFGREVFAERLVETLATKPMVGVIGPSGSGKSSVVFAGMLPRLREAGLAGSGLVDATHAEPGADRRPWTVLHMRPGAEPFHALAAVLVPLLEGADSRTDRLIATRKMTDALADGTLDVGHVLGDVRRDHPELGPLLFIVDQFEELYTLCPDIAVQRRFQDLLFETAFGANGAGPVRLALTLRADFMGHATAYRPFSDAIQDHNVILGPMNAEELTRVIARPAELQGRTFEPGLVERIRRDVGEEAGSLPLLEFALTKLWEGQVAGTLTHASYEALGQVEGAVARHADAVYEGLEEDDRALARKVIVQMVRPGEGTEDTRRIARREELGDEGWGLVRQLADARLVVTNRDEEGRETAEVVHEALIRTWGRLKEWMAEDRRFRTWQERLRFAIRQWEEAGRDEGALLRGVPLAEAEAWAKERGAELTGEEASFVAASGAAAAARLAARRAMEARSRRLLRSLALVGTVAAIVGTGLAVVAQRARRQADDESIRSRSLALAAQSGTALERQQRDLAFSLAREATRLEIVHPAARLALTNAAYEPGLRRRFPGHDRWIFAIDMSADGHFVASGGYDGEIKVWDVASGELAWVQPDLGSPITALDFHPDGERLLSVSTGGRIREWDVETGAPVGVELPGPAGATDLQYLPSEGHVIGVGDGGRLSVWDLNTAREVIRLVGHMGQVTDVDTDALGRFALSGGEDRRVLLWSLVTGQRLRVLEGHEDRVTAVAISPDGRLGLSGSQFGDRSVRLWDLETGEELRRFTGHGQAVQRVAFTGDGRRALSGSNDGTLQLYDVGERSVERLIKAEAMGHAAFGAGGRTVAFSVIDRSIRVEDLDHGALIHRLVGEHDFVTDVSIDPSSERILTGSWDGSVREWDANSGRQLRHLGDHADAVYRVEYGPEGRYAASVGTDEVVRVWDLDAGMQLHALEGHTGTVSDVAFTPDGNRLVSGSWDRSLRVWEVATGALLHRFDVGSQAVGGLSVSPDGRTALAGGGFGVVSHVDLETGENLATLEGHTGTVFETVFAADGKTALSTADTLIHWDLEREVALRSIELAEIGYSVDISTDGRLALTGTGDGRVTVWDLASGLALRHLDGHAEGVDAVAFSPDGRFAVSGSRDDSAIVWRIDRSEESLEAWISGNREPVPLTCLERRSHELSPCPDEAEAGEQPSAPASRSIAPADSLPKSTVSTIAPAAPPPAPDSDVPGTIESPAADWPLLDAAATTIDLADSEGPIAAPPFASEGSAGLRFRARAGDILDVRVPAANQGLRLTLRDASGRVVRRHLDVAAGDRTVGWMDARVETTGLHDLEIAEASDVVSHALLSPIVSLVPEGETRWRYTDPGTGGFPRSSPRTANR